MPDSPRSGGLLLWFTSATTAAQRALIEALLDDLEGTRSADREALTEVLENMNNIDCQSNAQLCFQICLWAVTRCNVCDTEDCRSNMQERCGLDCATL